MKIGTKHPTGFDALYAWVDSVTGKWCMDFDDVDMTCVQEATYEKLCKENGLNYFSEEPHPIVDGQMEGIGWIYHAKRLGVLRLRTKEERERQDRSVFN